MLSLKGAAWAKREALYESGSFVADPSATTRSGVGTIFESRARILRTTGK